MFPGVLRAFHEVVQAGSISKAGKHLGLAPSSVSRQIAILERQMGTTLFKRSLEGVELTHAGSILAEYAHSVILDFESLKTELNDIRGVRRLIRITMVESIVSAGPAAAIKAFLEEFKLVTFEFHVVPAPFVVEAIKANQCEIGIAFCAAPDPAVVNVARIHEPIVLLLPSNHPLAARDEVTLNDVASFPLALPDNNFGIRRRFDRACQAAGLSCVPILQSNSFEALRDFVRVGAGGAVLPKRAAVCAQEANGLKIVSLAHEEFQSTTLDLVILKQRRIPRIIRLFVETLAASIEADHGTPSADLAKVGAKA